MVFKSSRRKQVRKVSFKSNNTRCITVKIITFQEETDTDSGTNINDEIIYDKNTSE